MERISLFVPILPVVASINGLHVVAFHLAMLFTGIPPASEKNPPANTAPVSSKAIVEIGPFVPSPSDDQVEPFQKPILFAVMVPIWVKSPAAYKFPLGAMAIENIVPLLPAPKDSHSPLELIRARLDTVIPPALEKLPPT